MGHISVVVEDWLMTKPSEGKKTPLWTIFYLKYFIEFLEREEEEGEKHSCESEISISYLLHTPYRG